MTRSDHIATGGPDDPTPEPVDDPVGDRRYRLALAGGFVALVAFHLWASWRVTGPSVVYDEQGYLGNARLLARGARWDMPQAPTYAVGYPVVIAPAMVLFSDAAAQWRAVMALNAVLLAALLPGLAFVLRRVLAVPRSTALAAAAVGSLAPCAVAAGVSAIAENLVLPLVVLTVAAAWALTDSGRPRWSWWRLAFGPAVATLVAAHPRFTLALGVAAVALVAGAWRGVVGRRLAAANLALLVLGASAGRLLNQRVQAARWTSTEDLQGGPSDWLELLRTPQGIGEVALTAVGQAWYLAMGSVGLVVVGIWALVVHLRPGSRRPAADPAATPVDHTATGPTTAATGPGQAVVARDRAFVVATVLGLAAGVFITSVAFFSQNQFRADHWVYGRHNDSFTPLWVAVAVAALLGHATVLRKLAWLGSAALVVAATGLVVVLGRDPMELKGEFSPFAVPAIGRFPGSDPATTLERATAAGLLAVAVAAVLVALSGRRGHAAERRWSPALAVVPLLAAGWFTYAGFGTVRGTERFRQMVTADWSAAEELSRLGIDRLQVEGSTARGFPTLLYPFHLPDVDVTVYDAGAGEEPVGPYVLARLDDPARPAAGDRVVLLDQGALLGFWDSPVGLAVWVRPGVEQERLAAAGHLLPAGFPIVLPPEARSVELEIVGDRDDPLVVASGGRGELTVRGRHTGRGAPWPDDRSFRLPGKVRVEAQVRSRDPAGPDGIGSGGELSRWVRPGQEFTSQVAVHALGAFFSDLPPGLYDVQLGVGQDGEDWFTSAGEPGRFVLEVTDEPPD